MTDTVAVISLLTAEPHEHHAEVVHRAGIWVVHRSLDGVEWTITHEPAGLQVASSKSFECAKDLANDLRAKFPQWGLDLPWGPAGRDLVELRCRREEPDVTRLWRYLALRGGKLVTRLNPAERRFLETCPRQLPPYPILSSAQWIHDLGAELMRRGLIEEGDDAAYDACKVDRAHRGRGRVVMITDAGRRALEVERELERLSRCVVGATVYIADVRVREVDGPWQTLGLFAWAEEPDAEAVRMAIEESTDLGWLWAHTDQMPGAAPTHHFRSDGRPAYAPHEALAFVSLQVLR